MQLYNYSAGVDPGGQTGWLGVGGGSWLPLQKFFYMSVNCTVCNNTNVTTPYTADAVVVAASLIKTHN